MSNSFSLERKNVTQKDTHTTSKWSYFKIKGFGKGIHGTAIRDKSNCMICNNQALINHKEDYKHNDEVYPDCNNSQKSRNHTWSGLWPQNNWFSPRLSGAQEHVDHYMIEIRLRTSAPFYDNEKQ